MHARSSCAYQLTCMFDASVRWLVHCGYYTKCNITIHSFLWRLYTDQQVYYAKAYTDEESTATIADKLVHHESDEDADILNASQQISIDKDK